MAWRSGRLVHIKKAVGGYGEWLMRGGWTVHHAKQHLQVAAAAAGALQG